MHKNYNFININFMAKYSKDIDEDLKKKVLNAIENTTLGSYGLDIEVIRLTKSKKEIGEVLRGSSLVSLFTGKPELIVIALYEEAFERVDEETQDIWIESLISQIGYDDEKDKIIITKPELNVPLGLYRKYGDLAVKKTELSIMTVQQIVNENSSKK